jgi:hypothetical protein
MNKLEIQPIPDSSKGKNLRYLLGKTKWDEISRTVRGNAGYTCEICGEKKENQEMHAHEVWSYNKKFKVQHLDGIMCVCDLCHGAIHYLRTSNQEDPETVQLVTKKYLTVNQCDSEQLKRDKEEAIKTVEDRSKISWKIDFSKAVSDKLIKLSDINLTELENMSPGSSALLVNKQTVFYIERFGLDRYLDNFKDIITFIKAMGGKFDEDKKQWYLTLPEKNGEPLFIKEGELNLNYEVIKELEQNSYIRGAREGFKEGLGRGYKDGFKAGIDQGYNDGIKAGFDQGFNEGFTKAKEMSIIGRISSWFKKSQ